MLTAVRRLLGQDSIGPSGVFDQSVARISPAISPLPANMCAAREAPGSVSSVAGSSARAPSTVRDGMTHPMIDLRGRTFPASLRSRDRVRLVQIPHDVRALEHSKSTRRAEGALDA